MSQPIVEKEAGPPVQPETPDEAPEGEKRVRNYKDFGHDEIKATRMFSHSRILVSSLYLTRFIFSRRPC